MPCPPDIIWRRRPGSPCWRGGNAIDAACCAGIALGVLHPDEVNVAGVAPIMIRTGQGKVVTIAGLGHCPKNITPDLFMREHCGVMPPDLAKRMAIVDSVMAANVNLDWWIIGSNLEP